MARRSGGSRPTGRSRSPPPATSHTAQPATRGAAPPPAQSGGGGGGFLSNMAGAVTSGIGHGIGFGIAGRAVDAVLGPRSMQVTHSNEQGSAAPVEQTSAPMNSNRSCQLYVDDLNQCMSRHSDISLCQNYFEALKSCQNSA